MDAVQKLVSEFGSAILLEQYFPRYRYRVPKGDKSVGYFFTFMEELKARLNIDEYSASQTTLEQIFNGFAREDEKEVKQREFKFSQGNALMADFQPFGQTVAADDGLNLPSDNINVSNLPLLTNHNLLQKEFNSNGNDENMEDEDE